MEPALNRKQLVARYADSVRDALAAVPERDYEAFCDALVGAEQIVTAGRGRSGMMASAFARRLGQMGLRAWGLDDTTVPRLGERDVMVAATGSGTTPTVLSLMHTARQGGARVLAVTRAPDAIGDAADQVVVLDVPRGPFPLGTLFEAALLGFLDQVVVDLVAALGATESDLGARHTNLE